MVKKYVQIDEDGYPLFDGIRVTDEDYGKKLLSSIQKDSELGFTYRIDSDYIVEAFDEPYVAKQVLVRDNQFFIQLPYNLIIPFELNTLTLDEWDRFHGNTQNEVGFVFSRAAQNEFFNLLDEFDDESITYLGKKYVIPDWLFIIEELNSEFWSSKYTEHENNPPWDMNAPHPNLVTTMAQLKLLKSRVLVLGCGRGHDAAYLAEQGHMVTAVDYSDVAIAEAQKKYGHIENLKLCKLDVFNLPDNFTNSFDLVFEHTLFCAIDPKLRNKLIKVWQNCLVEGGHLLAVFFVHKHNGQLPFGSSEWELRQRLKKKFNFIYWTRWRGHSTRSPGMELISYSKGTGFSIG